MKTTTNNQDKNFALFSSMCKSHSSSNYIKNFCIVQLFQNFLQFSMYFPMECHFGHLGSL